MFVKEKRLSDFPTAENCQGHVTAAVTLHVHTRSGFNRIIPLMRRPNTDSTPNKPVTLPRNQLLLTLRGHELRPHCHDTVLRYAVTLQVCTYPKIPTEERIEFHSEDVFYLLTYYPDT
jgi:hypothetical protein